MKMIIPILICLVFLVQASADEQTIKDMNDHKTIEDVNVFRALYNSDKKFIEFIPKLRQLGQKSPNNVEIQLGLAHLYDVNPGHTSEGISSIEQYEKVLRLDPNNRPASAFLTKRLCLEYAGKSKSAIEQLELKIQYAKKHNANVIMLDSFISAKFLKEHWFKEDDRGITITQEKYKDSNGNPVPIVKIHNFILARKNLQKNLDEQAQAVIKTTEKNQSKDPDNALYNYLKARIYFAMEKDDDALKEIEKGVAKKCCNSFDDERRGAAARVLGEVDFPQSQRDIVNTCNLSDGFISMNIWRKKLSDLSENYESQGDFKKAEKIYDLTAKMAKQCDDKLHPLGLEKVALKRLDEVHKKMSQVKSK